MGMAIINGKTYTSSLFTVNGKTLTHLDNYYSESKDKVYTLKEVIKKFNEVQDFAEVCRCFEINYRNLLSKINRLKRLGVLEYAINFKEKEITYEEELAEIIKNQDEINKKKEYYKAGAELRRLKKEISDLKNKKV